MDKNKEILKDCSTCKYYRVTVTDGMMLPSCICMDECNEFQYNKYEKRE